MPTRKWSELHDQLYAKMSPEQRAQSEARVQEMTARANQLSAAETATKKIQDHAAEAARVLREGYDGRIMVNFYGIFSSPTDRGSDLRIARDKINEALALMEATNWPKDADYEAAERDTGCSADGEETH